MNGRKEAILLLTFRGAAIPSGVPIVPGIANGAPESNGNL
jgi:hypothetical protein